MPPATPMAVVFGKLGRAPQPFLGQAGGAAGGGPVGARVQLSRQRLLRGGSGQGPVPDGAVRIAAQRGSERLVDGSSLLSEGRLSDRRPDQRMAEAERVALDEEHPKMRGLVQIGLGVLVGGEPGQCRVRLARRHP